MGISTELADIRVQRSRTQACGNIFSITPAGVLTNLFDLNWIDGAGPLGLVEAANGLVYAGALPHPERKIEQLSSFQ
jgi:hypothetical protein